MDDNAGLMATIKKTGFFPLFYSVSSSSCLVVYHLVIRSKFRIKFWDATHGEHVDSYPLPLSLSDSSFQKVVDIYKGKKKQGPFRRQWCFTPGMIFPELFCK